MDRTERFYRLQQLLEQRRVVPRELALVELGVSLATFKRDLEYLRERLHAPIVWDREQGGYRFEAADPHGPRYGLPGLWFNASEIHALLTMEQLLANLQPGLLEPHVGPLRQRIRVLLDSGDHSADEVSRRIRLLQSAARQVDSGRFQRISHGLLARQRLRIVHYNRARDEESVREVSPQRLVYYRDNWYLDAWCHARKGLRSFAVDSIRDVTGLDTRAREVSASTLERELAAGYGIFAGARTRLARLRFTPERARWVAQEHWHPRQQGWFEADGHYRLDLPYSGAHELVMDILKYGPDVEVLAPADLRRRVAGALAEAARQYR